MSRSCDLCYDPEPGSIWVGRSDVALCDPCYDETVRSLPPTHAQPDPRGLAGPRRPV